MEKITIAITAASYNGNKGAAAMLQSSIKQLYARYGEALRINLMSTYPEGDKRLKPFDFINIVSAKPEQLVFIAFPLAVLYWLFRWFKPIKSLILKNKILKAYSQTDLVVDEAGISFVDSRGFVMNTYAFICAAVPLLVGTPVVKYSQALGEFKNPYNRFLAKWILPKLKLICARGEITLKNLEGIGVAANVKMCADGAFSMPDDESVAEQVLTLVQSDSFYAGKVISLSISSVVQKKCIKLRINYAAVMTAFINWLNELGYNVLIIANAAREGSEKPRNNDLLICGEVYGRVRDKARVRWYNREMGPEEIRELIARSDALVASRFHAMIGALEKGVPVLLIGWSHKYKEVLDMFDLGQYSQDFSSLNLDNLKGSFLKFIADEDEIRSKINNKLDYVKKCSANNISFIGEVIDEVTANRGNNGKN